MLKDERIKKGLTLEQVASATKINVSYLTALENNEYHRFPSSVYARGFLQNYAKYLETDVEKVIALYRRSVSDSNINPEIKEPTKKPASPKFILTPGLFLITFVVLLVITTLGYLIIQYYNFQKPPALTLESPENASVVDSSPITVKGTTDTGMFVTINDEPVKVDDDGTFESSVGLTKGSNTIIVKSRHPDNIGKEAVITITVEYELQEEEPPDETVEGASEEPAPAPTTIALSVSVLAESAWLEITVDDVQVFASVAPPLSKYDYTAEKNIFVRTGRLSSTQVSVNGEARVLFPESGGVASILCDIRNNSVDCRQL
jgi:cytoskeletal protein RodZ